MKLQAHNFCADDAAGLKLVSQQSIATMHLSTQQPSALSNKLLEFLNA